MIYTLTVEIREHGNNKDTNKKGSVRNNVNNYIIRSKLEN